MHRSNPSIDDFHSQGLSFSLQPFSHTSGIAADYRCFICREVRVVLVAPSSEFLVMNFLLKVLIINMTAPLISDYHPIVHRFVVSDP